MEDDDNILNLLNIILSEDYETKLARNGKEALDCLNDFYPDLIILDIMMEVMDGITALQKIKENENTKSIKVVMLSAKCQKSDMIVAKEYGAVDFITKPFDPVQLKEMVKDLILK
ncbi:response regulator [Candidatus Woesearchaeota archaeon]|nr:response regulator [Candidatus Woesearchaeota archaeon]MBT6505493.1 response regulator [Candidatus Woesearchaeota archaeon]